MYIFTKIVIFKVLLKCYCIMYFCCPQKGTAKAWILIPWLRTGYELVLIPWFPWLRLVFPGYAWFDKLRNKFSKSLTVDNSC